MTLIRFLYANGCSWTEGQGIESDPSIPRSMLEKPMKMRNLLAWPQRLASMLDAEHLNESEGGGSNARIVRKTVEFVRRWPKENRSELLVVIGWTSIERDEVFVSYRNVRRWYRMNAWQRFSNQWGINKLPSFVSKKLDQYQETRVRYLIDERECLRKHLQEVYLLANLLENLGIKFMFFSSIGGIRFPNSDMDPLTEFNIEMEYLNDPRFVGMHRSYSMSMFCSENNLPISQCCHPMAKAHQAWAKHLHGEYLKIYDQNEIVGKTG